jgi:hypothetical protein
VEAKECVECARERVVAEHMPTSPEDVSEGGSRGGREGGKRGKGIWGWLNAQVSDPVPLGVGYQVPNTSAHAATSTWGAMANIGEDRVEEAPTIAEEEEEVEVYGRGDYTAIAAEEVETEKMSLAELLRTPPPERFAATPVYAASPPRVERGGAHTYSAFPAPMRGDERGNGSNANEPKGDWTPPEEWQIEEGKKKKEKWYKGLFEYREGYAGGAF